MVNSIAHRPASSKRLFAFSIALVIAVSVGVSFPLQASGMDASASKLVVRFANPTW
jgi:hypothetical protein